MGERILREEGFEVVSLTDGDAAVLARLADPGTVDRMRAETLAGENSLTSAGYDCPFRIMVSIAICGPLATSGHGVVWPVSSAAPVAMSLSISSSL